MSAPVLRVLPWVLRGLQRHPAHLGRAVLSLECTSLRLLLAVALVTLKLPGCVFDSRHSLPHSFGKLALESIDPDPPEAVRSCPGPAAQPGPPLLSPLDALGPALLPSQPPGPCLPESLARRPLCPERPSVLSFTSSWAAGVASFWGAAARNEPLRAWNHPGVLARGNSERRDTASPSQGPSTGCWRDGDPAGRRPHVHTEGEACGLGPRASDSSQRLKLADLVHTGPQGPGQALGAWPAGDPRPWPARVEGPVVVTQEQAGPLSTSVSRHPSAPSAPPALGDALPRWELPRRWGQRRGGGDVWARKAPLSLGRGGPALRLRPPPAGSGPGLSEPSSGGQRKALSDQPGRPVPSAGPAPARPGHRARWGQGGGQAAGACLICRHTHTTAVRQASP